MHPDSGSNRECRTAPTVAARIRAASIRVALVTACLLVHGCDTGSGGAVELSWKLRPASSLLNLKFVDCDSGQPGAGIVNQIRLHWSVGGTESSRAWACDDNHGATGFDLDVGLAQLWVTPECVGGAQASATTFIAPAIVEREVIRGETVSLGAVELVVAVSNCATAMNTTGQPCICTGSN
jgi:hypothetical protein